MKSKNKSKVRFNIKEKKVSSNTFRSIACDEDDPLVLLPNYIPPLLKPIAIRPSR